MHIYEDSSSKVKDRKFVCTHKCLSDEPRSALKNLSLTFLCVSWQVSSVGHQWHDSHSGQQILIATYRKDKWSIVQGSFLNVQYIFTQRVISFWEILLSKKRKLNDISTSMFQNADANCVWSITDADIFLSVFELTLSVRHSELSLPCPLRRSSSHPLGSHDHNADRSVPASGHHGDLDQYNLWLWAPSSNEWNNSEFACNIIW